MNMDKSTIFRNRLTKIGVDIKLGANVPWIYIDSINGKDVTETFRAEHGFTVAFLPMEFVNYLLLQIRHL